MPIQVDSQEIIQITKKHENILMNLRLLLSRRGKMPKVVADIFELTIDSLADINQHFIWILTKNNVPYETKRQDR